MCISTVSIDAITVWFKTQANPICFEQITSSQVDKYYKGILMFLMLSEFEPSVS